MKTIYSLLVFFLFCSSVTAQQIVDYGLMAGSGWGNYGENNTMGTIDINSVGSAVVDMGNFDHNYWNGVLNGNLGDAVVTNLTFNSGTNTSLFRTAETAWSGSISCDGSYSIKPKGNQPLSVNNALGYDTCAHLKQWEAGEPADQEQYREQYDTLRLYIEHCAASDDQSFGAFNDLSSAVQVMSSDSTRFDNFRDWLISVLYLNTTNPEYFCACVGTMASTYQLGSIYDHVQNASLAVLNYLHYHHPECWVQKIALFIPMILLMIVSKALTPRNYPPWIQ